MITLNSFEVDALFTQLETVMQSCAKGGVNLHGLDLVGALDDGAIDPNLVTAYKKFCDHVARSQRRNTTYCAPRYV